MYFSETLKLTCQESEIVHFFESLVIELISIVVLVNLVGVLGKFER